ncbi:hypothetical protein DYQ86_08570 [Acidobacteria bacterium AB60]|nr:hypothetical protein DYQ86_08570 [Acidobacteria bacterium AB60]
MDPHSDPNPRPDQPPRAAAWILGLFADGEEREHILGDLSEEYFARQGQARRKSGRGWYWRQILGSLPHLIGVSLRTAPVTTILALAAGFAFRKMVAPRIEPALFALIDQTQVYEHHFSLYRFLASTGIDIGHLIVFLLSGILIGVIAGRRAIAPAIALALIYAGMTVAAMVLVVLKYHDLGYLMRLTWYFSDDLAIVVGAALARTLRRQQMRPAAP